MVAVVATFTPLYYSLKDEYLNGQSYHESIVTI